jgi:general stress protein YciG
VELLRNESRQRKAIDRAQHEFSVGFHAVWLEPLLHRTRAETPMAIEDRGFASMDRNRQREIASKGGRAAHKKGAAHEWTREEAQAAGRKGGLARHKRPEEIVVPLSSSDER